MQEMQRDMVGWQKVALALMRQAQNCLWCFLDPVSIVPAKHFLLAGRDSPRDPLFTFVLSSFLHFVHSHQQLEASHR